MALSPKRQAFLCAYLGDAQFNATEAARRAGYKHPEQQGHRLKKVQEIAEAIERAQAAMQEHSGRTLQDLIDWYWDAVEGRVTTISTSLSGDVMEIPLTFDQRFKGSQGLRKVMGWDVDRMQLDAHVSVEPAEVSPGLAKTMIRMMDAQSKDVTNE